MSRKALQAPREQHTVQYALVMVDGVEVGHLKQMSSGRVGVTLNHTAGCNRGHKLLAGKDAAVAFVVGSFSGSTLVSKWVQL